MHDKGTPLFFFFFFATAQVVSPYIHECNVYYPFIVVAYTLLLRSTIYATGEFHFFKALSNDKISGSPQAAVSYTYDAV